MITGLKVDRSMPVHGDASIRCLFRMSITWIVLFYAFCLGAASAGDDCPGHGSPRPELHIPNRVSNVADIPAKWEIKYTGSSPKLSLAAGQRAYRPIVLEDFTATWCPYCYSIGTALDRIQEEYSPRELLIMSYHVWGDAFVIPFTDDRINKFYVLPAIAKVLINNKAREEGGHSISEGEAGIAKNYDSLKAKIQSERNRIGASVPFPISFSGTYSPNSPSFDVIFTNELGYAKSVNMVVVVVEDGIPFDCENGETKLNSVVRAHLGTQALRVLSPGGATIRITYNGTIPCNNPANQYPVVFLQEVDSYREILGAAALRPNPAKVNTNWSLYQ